ncbi:toll/interleukin-1 receptor domain-containing protein [Sphingomonas sp.]|uniref:toll/interleukin-1 receptor domain-containing protein n=1 Tax=Sphingomonas sp. TaxID=28214 RepID=UPI003F6F01B6
MSDIDTVNLISAEPEQPLRHTVFISHANPEDNEFAAWLGTRLIGAGYQVWSDLLRLVGGEPFWRDIGDAIKDHAAVVVLVLSRASVTKPGVLDEIALAVATSRKLQNQRFIIPVRLDDLPFDEFPEQVIRLNAINFNGNWADGLHRLFEALDERAIEKSEGASSQGIAEFRNFRLRQSAAIADQPEQVEGNWLKILALPAQAHLCRFGAEPKTVAKHLGRFRIPIVPWDRLGFGFARAAEIIEVETPEIAAEPAYDIDLQKFLKGEPSGGPQLRGVDARRMMVNLLRQAWEHFLLSKGMRSYEFAHGTAFYIPRGLIDKDTVAFIDRNGKTRRKRLSGRSIKRNVYWSFAISIHPVVGRQWHFELKPQVVFTTDGVTPIDSKVKMARLRKSFCKNWWNDQWRALLNGFVTFLADGEDAIAVPLGGCAQLKLAASLALFEAPTTIIGDGVASLEDADSDVDSETGADLLDDGEDVGPFDDLEDEDAA